jgi:hypothetical protein
VKRERTREEYESGDFRLKAVALRSGMTLPQLKVLARREGWRRPKRKPMLLPLERAVLRVRYESAEPLDGIASDFDRTQATLYGTASRLGWRRKTLPPSSQQVGGPMP